MEILREFFGYGEKGYTRQPSGAYSAEHLIFVTSVLVFMAALAVVLGRRNRQRPWDKKNSVLIWAAVAINGFELIKIVAKCLDNGLDAVINLLPLYLCSVQLIAIPLAALSKGRLREAALDFVCILGPLGALAGTYGASQNYACFPVLSADNVISGLTHGISGFAAVYIMVSGMASLKRKNMPITYVIILCFCIPAYVVNYREGTNYMFLMRSDGTPYEILYQLVDGHRVLYPLGVVLLFFIYIAAFYQVYYMIAGARAHRRARLLARR